jgi:glycosyltransferase involved in cell wall biosynthesis
MDYTTVNNISSDQDITDDEIAGLMQDQFREGGVEYAYSLPLAHLAVPGICGFYGVHLAIWQLRARDLQLQFRLNTPLERCKFLAWCLLHGQHEYEALRELIPFWSELAEPARIQTTEWSKGISRLLQLAIMGRPDLSINPDLSNAEDQEKALAWFYLFGGHKELGQNHRSTPTWLRNALLGGDNFLTSKFARLVHKNRPDVKAAFDITTAEGLTGFNSWLINHGTSETGLLDIAHPSIRAWPTTEAHDDKRLFGVNLIGYAYGELGIGEDVRMAAHALKASGVPFTVINVVPGDNVSQNDASIHEWVGEEPIYLFNVICLTALEHLHVYLTRGSKLFQGKYNIGYWPWELHLWPLNWEHCFNLVDEIWASSRHIERSTSFVEKVPVTYMPMALLNHEKSMHKKQTRQVFNLPETGTLFVFSFDGNSYIKRKNPIGIVKAFKSAFPSGKEEAYLVIKCMRPAENNPEWAEILDAASRDKRLIILNMTLTKTEVMNLYSCCDCFVSLHRAEGFGRGIAEALTLGLDVIATGYGGNVDFCLAAGAKLVPYELISTNDGDYVEAKNNYWAEPDLQSAANAMREVHLQFRTKGLDGKTANQHRIFDNLFSPTLIGAKYKSRLDALYHALAKPIGKSEDC